MGMAHQHIGQRLQFIAGIARARRVRGRVEDEPFGFRRDRGLKLCGGQFEIRLDPGHDRNRGAACQQDHIRIADPIGGGDDHLVARIAGRHQCVVQDLLAAGTDRNLRGRVGQAVFLQEFRTDRRLQFRDAIHGGIAGLAGVDGALGRLADVLWGVEVRLARAKADHVLAFGLQLLRLGGDRDRGRGFDPRQRV